MAIINITDKFTEDKPAIQFKGKVYEVNNSMDAVMGFEEKAGSGDMNAIMKALEGVLGKANVKEMELTKLSIANFQVFTVGLMAAMQGVSYEDAAARFQRS